MRSYDNQGVLISVTPNFKVIVCQKLNARIHQLRCHPMPNNKQYRGKVRMTRSLFSRTAKTGITKELQDFVKQDALTSSFRRSRLLFLRGAKTDLRNCVEILYQTTDNDIKHLKRQSECFPKDQRKNLQKEKKTSAEQQAIVLSTQKRLVIVFEEHTKSMYKLSWSPMPSRRYKHQKLKIIN